MHEVIITISAEAASSEAMTALIGTLLRRLNHTVIRVFRFLLAGNLTFHYAGLSIGLPECPQVWKLASLAVSGEREGGGVP